MGLDLDAPLERGFRALDLRFSRPEEEDAFIRSLEPNMVWTWASCATLYMVVYCAGIRMPSPEADDGVGSDDSLDAGPMSSASRTTFLLDLNAASLGMVTSLCLLRLRLQWFPKWRFERLFSMEAAFFVVTTQFATDPRGAATTNLLLVIGMITLCSQMPIRTCTLWVVPFSAWIAQVVQGLVSSVAYFEHRYLDDVMVAMLGLMSFYHAWQREQRERERWLLRHR